MTYTHITIAGQSVLDEIDRERAATVLPSKRRPGCFDSETLCAHQRQIAARGYLGAEIVQTIRGFSLRYDSGLQNWGLIERGLLTWDAALAAAHRWQAGDPARRYVTWTEARP
jgi:hypothetical protein